MNTRIMIEKQDEISRIKALQKEIEQLKKLLLKKDLDQLVNDSYLESATEKLKYKNVAELKKTLISSPDENDPKSNRKSRCIAGMSLL